MMPITASNPIHGAQSCGGLREDRERDADEAVGTELQQDRGQQHRADRRRLGVRVRQPRVEREHRHLDREAEEQARRRSGSGSPGRCRRRPSGSAQGSGTCPRGRTAPGTPATSAPSRTSVNRKNLIDAYSRFGPPHTPIMKNIGSRTISKKMKKRIRSSARNVPFMPTSSSRISARKRLRVVRLREVVPGVDDAQDRDEHRQDEQRQRDAVDPEVVARP